MGLPRQQLKRSRASVSVLAALAAASVVSPTLLAGVAPKLPAGTHRPRQDLGQSYLSDPNTASKIVSTFQAGSAERFGKDAVGGLVTPPVVELGPGLGALTNNLAPHFPGMVAVEIDSRAVEVLRRNLPQLEVLQQDLLQLNHSELATRMGGRLHVVGNLPYSITTDALLSLVSSPGALRYAVVMVQREAAARMIAPPGSKDYGPLSAMLQNFARLKQLFLVPPTAFYPPPKVTSAVVELDFYDADKLPQVKYDLLLEVVKLCFRQRKRALKHSLKMLFEQRRAALPPRWGKRRAEQLVPADFVELAMLIK